MHPSRGWRMCRARSLLLNQISILATVGRLVEQRGGVPMIPHTSCQGKEAIFPRVSAWLGAINTSCLLRTSRSAPPWEYLGNILGISWGVCRRTVPYTRQLPSDDVGNSRTRLFLLRQQTFYIVRLITFAAALFFFFYHQFVEFNYGRCCHGSTPGHRSSVLESSMFGEKICSAR